MDAVPDRLRADAARNRDALIAAAGEVFGERGLGAPLDEIARRAEVGNATLYRRFPTRRSLLVAVFAERMADHLAAARRGLEDPDPWAGFCGFVRRICALQVRDRALADLLTTFSSDGDDEVERLRSAAYEAFRELAARAQSAGALRTDFKPEDLIVLLMANAGLVERTGGDAAAASARLAGLVLDGLSAGAMTSGPPPLDEAATLRAMRRQAGCR